MSCPNCKCDKCKASQRKAREVDDRRRVMLAIELLLLAGVDEFEIQDAFKRPRATVRLAREALCAKAGLPEGHSLASLAPFERRLYEAKAIPVTDRYGYHGDWKLLSKEVELPPDNWPIGTTRRKP